MISLSQTLNVWSIYQIDHTLSVWVYAGIGFMLIHFSICCFWVFRITNDSRISITQRFEKKRWRIRAKCTKQTHWMKMRQKTLDSTFDRSGMGVERLLKIIIACCSILNKPSKDQRSAFKLLLKVGLNLFVYLFYYYCSWLKSGWPVEVGSFSHYL